MPSSTAALVACMASSTRAFFFLHLRLGRRADLDHRHTAHELRQPFLQLLAVVVRRGLLDLGADLLDSTFDGGAGAITLDDGRVVLVDRDLLRLAKILHADVLELQPEILGDRLAAGEHGDVLEHRLPPVAEARRFDGRARQRATELVDHQGRQGLTVDVFRDDQQRAVESRDLLEQRQQVLHRADLLLVDQDDRVLEHDLHPVGVGDEVRRKIATVELHPLDHLELGLEGAGLFDGDDAVLADLVHRFGDDPADGLVVVRGDLADLGDHVAR